MGTKTNYSDSDGNERLGRRVKSFTNESRKVMSESQKGWSPYKTRQVDRIALSSGSDPENSGSGASSSTTAKGRMSLPERTIHSASDAPTTTTVQSGRS